MKISFSTLANQEISKANECCYIDLENTSEVLDYASDVLSENCSFHISGFGQNSWPVDVRTDLPVFLEQLPGLVVDIQHRNNSELDFYEQGIERKLVFVFKKNYYEVHCYSQTDWVPSQQPEVIASEDLLCMLFEIKKEFCAQVEKFAPTIVLNAHYIDWKASIPVKP